MVSCVKKCLGPALAFLVLEGNSAWLCGQSVNLNGNGMSDLWELLYDAGNLDPGTDTDGDGVSNHSESIAGTDPWDANSVPKITAVAYYPSNSYGPSNISISMPGFAGKLYSLQSVHGPSDTPWSNWVTETTLLAPAGTTLVTLEAAVNTNATFFRVLVNDVDWDGDGVNDWEELQLGLDPKKAISSGELDGFAQPISDYAYVTNKLAAQNRVTIRASNPSATQPEPGQAPVDIAGYTLTRGGFPLNQIDVALGINGPGSGLAVENLDYSNAFPRTVTFLPGVSTITLPVIPLANPGLKAAVVANVSVLAGPKYRVGSYSNASVVIYPSDKPSGTGLAGEYFNRSSTTYSSALNFNPTNFVMTQLDPVVDFTWPTNALPITNSSSICVRWSGQVQPEFTETYVFLTRTDDGAKLWVNDQLIIDKWVAQTATEWPGSIDLQAGVKYNIRLEFFFNSGSGPAAARLSWYSDSQVKQIIPSSRLYPAMEDPTPSAVVSSLSAIGFLGQPFSYAIKGANSPTLYSAAPIPPGLSFNPTNGILSGIPSLAGEFQVMISSSNAAGLAAAVLDVQILNTGSAVAREVWTGVPGVMITDIPISTSPGIVHELGSLETPTDYGDDYGERLRGYLTAPVTGNYYFWIAASDSAELWISNDSEPANKVKRAWVTPLANPAPPPGNGTAPRQWNLQPNQRSPWLALVAGQRYYLEILHKAGAGANDNLAVGWLQDPLGTNTQPAEVVPGYVLSPYYQPPAAYVPGTLYSANMVAQGSAPPSAMGMATLRVSGDGSSAVLRFQYSGLSSPVTGEHIHSDPYLNYGSQVIFDIDTATPQPDGSYLWNITPMSPLSVADILEIIQEGKAYINVHTVNFPSGEIRGNFSLANGSQYFTAPPAPPAWADDHTNANAAARFLIQAAFGPSPIEIAAVQSMGYEAWLDDQFTRPATHHLPYVLAHRSADPTVPFPDTLTVNSWWEKSLTANDQLRQRVAFALSEIFVVSDLGVLTDNPRALSHFYDTLLDNAFGNFRELLEMITLTPAMGLYLDMRGNDKGNITTGRHPNENYAREIMQLFSIGLNRMWPDGTLVMDSQANLVPTYDQNVIMGYARVFTGWNYYQTNQANRRLPTSFSPGAVYTNFMVLVPTHHELGTKRLLDNVVLPAAAGPQTNSANVAFDTHCQQDLELGLDVIANHQNVGPFICRQLIQRLVTSNPSRDYLYRVVQKFNDNGSGVRGDLRAVLKAILLDYEARSSTMTSLLTFGKQREPLLRATAMARAFPPPVTSTATFAQNGTRTIYITNPVPHRLNNGDVVYLTFHGAEPLPTSTSYTVGNASSLAFTANAGGSASGNYGWTNDTITITIGSHGLGVSNWVYLMFTTGPATNGPYQVLSVIDSSRFKVSSPGSTTNTGSCLFPKLSGGYTQSGTTITVSISGEHSLNIGDTVYINFTSGGAVDGLYQVASVPDLTRFTVTAALSTNQTASSLLAFPLAPPPVVRSGTVDIRMGTWGMATTDSDITQTPLHSPTVFNFFFPDYKFPGILAAAGLTTPEFQLTSDTEVALQMNFFYNGLFVSTNMYGLTGYKSGNGAVVVDLGPWMTTNYTSNTGIPSLVDAMSTLLTGGQLSSAARNLTINYATSLPYTTPTNNQMRDRVRAVVHLVVTSPNFIIQK